MKAPDHVKTPEQYIASLPESRRSAVQALHDAIREATPELTPEIGHGMLGYGPYHYKYSSGREGDWFVVCLANQKNYISHYICACDKGGYLVENNRERLGKVSTGKSCIRFKKLEDLNLNVATELVKKASALVKNGGFAM